MDTPAGPTLYAVDLTNCGNLPNLEPEEICAVFTDVLRKAGATILHERSHAFPAAGMTCVLILSESHAALHTWPETGTVSIDIFSCSTRLKSLEAIEEMTQFFGARQVILKEIPRADGHGHRTPGRD